MKLTKTLLFAAAVAATLAANQNSSANEPDAATSATPTRGILANPRALEEFPWLARQSSTRNQSVARSEDVLLAIKKNRALAASPRMREQFPELTRGGQLSSVASSKSGTQANQFDEVTKNRVPAASPRAREEFPWLARGYASDPVNRSFNVAPLK
jgi:hypothetical protein